MRTTLKRGQGRSAAADGNGSAALPPSVLSPMRRYVQPPPPPRTGLGLAGRILAWGFLVVLMLAAALAGGVYLWIHESVAAVQAHSPDVRAAEENLADVPPPNRAAIALVIGYDRRFGESATTPARSDTVMLLRADPRTKSISMLSLPRDLRVQIHCPGHSLYTDRINAAYSLCGAKGTLETVTALTSLPVNYLITVNFRGFKKVVNTLGGVWVDVDRRYYNDNRSLGPGFRYAAINLQPGYQRLTGGSALDYVRFRHTDSDLFRVARQQSFVTATKDQFSKAFSIPKIPKLIGAITSNVEVGVGGGKELGLGTLYSYAKFVHGLPPGHFFQARIDGLTGYSELSTAGSNLEEAIQEFQAPDVEAPKVATAVALGRKVRTAAPKPEETTISVLNGNGIPGSAGNAKYLLGQRGYRLVDLPSRATGNAPSFDYFHTKIYFDPSRDRARAAARSVARLFAPADAERRPLLIEPLANGAMVTVVVGKTFTNELTAPVSKTRELKQEPPQVAAASSSAEEAVRSAQAKVRFPLMVPTVVEISSVLDPGVPVRAYRITEDRKAVRVVFRTGSREYWGVQMTDWEDAPVLDERNFRHVLGGRTFDLYYRGPKLHMVVLRERGVTYWVVNTLLDKLSNETMLAIAKGLRPLGKKK